MTDRYDHPDFVLAFIPLALLVAYSVGTAIDARLVAITTAVGFCYLVMADGLFWHAPTE